MRNSTTVVLFVVGALIAHSLWSQFRVTSRHNHPIVGAHVDYRQTNLNLTAAVDNATTTASTTTPTSTTTTIPTAAPSILPSPRCAICLFGLPRAFESLVLPSLEKNVVRPNARHGCDYFVHYYNVTHEEGGRSGGGGAIRADEILQLADAVRRASDNESASGGGGGGGGGSGRQVVTRFAVETADDFWKRRGALVHKVRTAKDTEGRFLYFPWRALSYRHPTTTDNILKMWHSIQESWNLMQSHANETGVEYGRVAMIRSDVFYVTPFDVWELPSGHRDINNSVAVIPGFGRYNISDRLIYGPADAVKVWAAQRFQRMEAHVQWTLRNSPGMGLHSELFVLLALLEPIRKLGFRVEEHPTMCFYRARSDESVWTSDCRLAALRTVTKNLGPIPADRRRVETILGRTCGRRTRRALFCPRGSNATESATIGTATTSAVA
jgi:hypothetical protein